MREEQSDSDKRNKGDDVWPHRKLGVGELVGGAIVTAFVVSRLWISFNWVYSQVSRSKGSWKRASNSSFGGSFREEARKRYNRRMQEEYEEEMERVERIRRMQGVFNRERNKHRRNYESWGQNSDGSYHQRFQRNDWYWKGDTSFRDRGTDFRETTRPTRTHILSHHYSVLGLDRLRTQPYTDNEIKSAFRAKALEFHPDQNQDNKEVAEAKFREVMTAYEAIKVERKKQ